MACHLEALDDGERSQDAAGGPVLVRLAGQAEGTHGDEALLVAAQLQAGAAVRPHAPLNQQRRRLHAARRVRPRRSRLPDLLTQQR